MIVVIDYGMGNSGSVVNMLKRTGQEVIFTSTVADIKKASKIILPGVGAFDNGIENLQKLGLLNALNERVVVDKIPILGICLGMQLFGRQSEEGKRAGFGWLDAQTVRFTQDDIPLRCKIPHMGWNGITVRQDSPLFTNLDEEKRFYFVHSYHMQCNDSADILTRTNYGIEFTSAVCRGNILGTQFHPENSHRFGLEFFKAFMEWSPVPEKRG